MDKITTYRAFDGTTFDSESECMEYERKKITSDFSEKATEIIKYLKHNKLAILSFLTRIKHYCATFGEIGTCNGCIFADENKCCIFGDMPESIDIGALLDLTKEDNKDE